jgi:tRNA A37 threonylcarbamoyladenosine biosynthesis protein TsaE
MTEITLSDVQLVAVKQIKDWFKHETDVQQVFRLFGYAGTGKTTIVKFVLDELGLEPPAVLQACFTGKAAYVLQRRARRSTA